MIENVQSGVDFIGDEFYRLFDEAFDLAVLRAVNDDAIFGRLLHFRYHYCSYENNKASKVQNGSNDFRENVHCCSSILLSLCLLSMFIVKVIVIVVFYTAAVFIDVIVVVIAFCPCCCCCYCFLPM